jgi:hypothetical protein
LSVVGARFRISMDIAFQGCQVKRCSKYRHRVPSNGCNSARVVEEGWMADGNEGPCLIRRPL